MVNTLVRSAAEQLRAGLNQPRSREEKLRAAGTLGLPFTLAVVLGALTVQGAITTLAGLATVAVVALLLFRVEIAALVFVAVEPFEDYAKSLSASAVKLLGALVFVAWLLRAISRGRPVHLSHPVVRAAAVLFAILLAATVVHPNGALGTEVLTRYLSYLGALVVLVDTMHDRLTPRRVATVYVLACAAAAIFGLVAFFNGNLRAGGPVGDPNDFAFFLIAAVPLALALRTGSPWRFGYDGIALLMTVAVLATLSRGALTGAGVMLVYVLVTGRVRGRTIAAGVVVAAVVAGIVLLTNQGKISTSLTAKDSVAQQNVDERLVRWQAAAEMTADNPILGLGPAGFRENYDRYIDFRVTDPTHPLDVAHEMYLEVSAELGVPGLLAFVLVMAFGFMGARRCAGRDGPDRWLANGVVTAVIGTAVASAFLTEQYFLPVWLLAALGAALDPRSSLVPGDVTSTEPGRS